MIDFDQHQNCCRAFGFCVNNFKAADLAIIAFRTPIMHKVTELVRRRRFPELISFSIITFLKCCQEARDGPFLWVVPETIRHKTGYRRQDDDEKRKRNVFEDAPFRFWGFCIHQGHWHRCAPTALLWVLPKGSFLPPQHTRAFSILPLLMLRESNATCQGTLSHLLPPRMGWR